MTNLNEPSNTNENLELDFDELSLDMNGLEGSALQKILKGIVQERSNAEITHNSHSSHMSHTKYVDWPDEDDVPI